MAQSPTGGRTPMHPRVQALTQRPGVDAAFASDLALATQIDRAHIVMLTEQGVLPPATAAALLTAVDRLRALDFAPLRERPAPRGWYLMYETYLVDTLGPDIGGSLHIGRSRNDLTATLHQLKLREPFLGLLWECLRLLGALARQARRHARVVMPAFTHYQPAVPITYGHYLNGVAVALAADIEALLGVADDLDRCPLGAGGVGGTTVPVDSGRTARLLGFGRACPNSVEAVATRDAALRLLSSAAVIGVLLSRVSADLLLWTTADLGLLTVPDSLTGGSSMMPQKRNVFVLEHVSGKAAAPLGAFATAAAAMQKTPFSNAIAVHAEGTRPVADAVDQLTQAAELLRLVVGAARPDPERMLARAESGYTAATEAANRLALEGGLGFRDAHAAVARAVQQALGNGGEPLSEAVSRIPEARGLPDLAASPKSVAALAEYGGGPGPLSLDDCLESTRERLGGQLARLRALRERWRGYPDALDTAAKAVAAEGVTAAGRSTADSADGSPAVDAAESVEAGRGRER
ncbi:lyase family protein [Wenjunlia tyrosinilytica]|uniref:argininosuccinate lyase n=1 Tax=Wenjunlia tyrosinilytica TaxID=1544741 RepID=A0A917ZUH5_9ACTN|nr:lyase family protein [Wenjunlia tyrosinilytica]GGO94270.1 argininosuccinate lyase [Wenjunlia tyrosinilytica]